jgi:ATP-dependent RNA circularization protein (DNA/RNA ligase family)
MYRVYEKTYRIITPRFVVNGKLTLPKDEQNRLVYGNIEITEKMDGANTGIIRGNGEKWTLQKRRGLADSQHPQFSFFWNWARMNEGKILKLPKNIIVYGELLYARHNIHYDKLPSFFMCFDILKGEEYLRTDQKLEILAEAGLAHVPIYFTGKLEHVEDLEKFMNGISACAKESIAEGLVVKDYKKQLRGKLVRPEFMKDLDEDDHWMNRPVERNTLAEGLEWYA